jgi:PAB1-binding protein PBP1
MNGNKYNIFKKNPDINKNTVVLKDDIMSNIPEDAKNRNSEDEKLAQTKTEFRWRIFKSDNENEFIEISMKKPNESRLLFNHDGKWIESDNNSYDQYTVVKKYYAYL